ncbi:MAG: hypothetical protein LBN06_11175 [Prevotellaceae bacterium]|nr:hypothetical protein [Prevotellaceae bacterium]
MKQITEGRLLSQSDLDLTPLNKRFSASVWRKACKIREQGFVYRLTPEQTEQMSRHNRDFEAVSSEEELVLRHYRKPQPGEAGMFVTATDILERINVGVKMVLSTKKIGMVIKRLGFEKITKGKYHTIVYRVVEYTLEEISTNRRTAEELANIDYKLPF